MLLEMTRRRSLTRVIGASALVALLVTRGAVSSQAARAEVKPLNGSPALFIDGKPSPAAFMQFYDTTEAGARAFGQVGMNLWEIDIWDPLDFRELEHKVGTLVKGNPQALVLLRVNLNGGFPDDASHGGDIATAEDGTHWAYMGGRSDWFSVGAITDKDALPGRWTQMVFDVSKVDRRGVLRPFDLVLWHHDMRNRDGVKMRFLIGHVEYFSSDKPAARLVVADMESAQGLHDQMRYPKSPVISHEVVKEGKGSLVWEHLMEPGHRKDGLVCKGVEPPMDLSQFDRLSLWIYPDFESTFAIDVRIHSGVRRLGYPSFASERWVEAVKDTLRRLIAHLDASPLRAHVIGITLAAGLSAEWCWAGHYQDAGVDYSSAAAAKWREWLTARYRTPPALRTAWGKDAEGVASFGRVTPPSKAERFAPADLGDFLDPLKRRRVVDFNEFIGEVAASRVAEFGRAVKEASGGRLLTGALFGYLFGYGDYMGKAAQQSGHAMPEQAFASPSLDYFVCPFEYHDRGMGDPSMWGLPVDSIRAHGKLVINEADSFTHLAAAEAWNKVKTAEEAYAVLKRDAAASISKNCGWWWFYSRLGADAMLERDPDTVALAGQLNRWGEATLQSDRRSAAEIAVVVDRHSFLALHPTSLLPGLIYYETPELMRMGAPFDLYNLNDIQKVAEGNYKLVLFFNTFWVTPTQRKVIDRLKSGGRTLAFTYASGLLSEALSLVNIRQLTGITVCAEMRRAPVRVRTTSRKHAITKEAPDGFTFGGLDRQLSGEGFMPPAWYSKHPECHPLLFAEEGQGEALGILEANGKPGLVVQRHNGWRSVWCGAYTVPACVLRGLCRYAGVHVYSDAEDIVYANRDWLALHIASDGERALHLPEVCDLRDALTGKAIATKVRELQLKVRKGETYVFGLSKEKD